jgi:Ca2+-binding RTX toxin-like protein
MAKKFNGSKRGEKIVGTKGADKIKGKGGKDKIKGRGGNDALNGGKGGDKVAGGAGADRHLGGPGADVLKAADNKRDKAINGGPGKDRCIVDTALELSVVRGCETVVAGGGPGSVPAPGSGSLQVTEFTGLVCDTGLPLCVFTLSGTGADGLIGTVTGTGGVTGLGASVVVTGPDWTAAGVYGCTADGALTVTIGAESTTVPIDCTV